MNKLSGKIIQLQHREKMCMSI